MIDIVNLTKKFGQKTVLQNLDCKIADGCIYGLVGANGAGKSTFLRLLSGVYYAQQGSIEIDGKEVYDNPDIKKDIMFLSDDLYFPNGAQLKDVVEIYKSFYPAFDTDYFYSHTDKLKLGRNDKISTFSKGMKRQTSIIAALSCGTKYLFFDETFDGLDPVVRNYIKKLIYDKVIEKNATVILTSHNLRELEDICDHLGVLYQGGILFEGDTNTLKTNVFKVQLSLGKDFTQEDLHPLNILSFKKIGSVATVIVKGDLAEAEKIIAEKSPVIADFLPLTLEEVFIYEMEVLGYVFEDLAI